MSLSALRGGSRLWRSCKRPLLQGSLCNQQRRGGRMSHILKSPYDKKDYREITLRNGLTVLLVSDMDQTSLFPLPLEKNSQPTSSQTTLAADNSDTDTTDGTDGTSGSEEPMSGTEEDSDEECVEQVPGLLTSPARLHAKHTEKKSAAALCIGIGSFCDPEDIPGFAHFMEHMVFMGSKKYKKENAFDDFIAKHGGETNAWTDAERTTFFFDIHKKHFHKALDMFAQFFIAPLFLKGSVDREISAVDNEFQMILSSDSDRYHQLLGSLSFKDNPISRFLCGNKRTLKTVPEEQDIDVYGRLRDFWQRMYSAHYMTLVVQAPHNLDELQEIVYELFEEIPNNKQLLPSISEYRDPFVPRNFHKLFKVIPTEDCQRLDICWALPPLYKRFKVKPLDYLGVLITHEGTGSILSYLRKKAWALSLSGGNMGSGFDYNQLWSGFFVSIILTDEGMEHVSDVVRTVFEYIHMLQKCGPQSWFYSELRDIENIKFRFRDELDPIDNVEQIAENMHLYPLEHYLTGRSLILAYDPQLIRECVSYLAPAQSCLTLWTKAYENRGVCNQVEPWFNTRYSLSEIPNEWKLEWRDLTSNPELFLPEKNPFIPTNLDLLFVEGAAEYPTQVLDNEFCRMWYKKDKKFKMPKGFIMLHLMTPMVSNSVSNATLSDLYINILQQQLLESLYAATLTGYEFSLEVLSTGMVFHVEGFSSKLPRVLELIVNHMSEFTVTQELFNAVKCQLKKCYYNEMIKTYEFAKMLRFALTEPSNPPLPDRYQVTGSLTLDMLLEFHQKIMDGLYVEGLVTGNFSPQHAVNVGEFVQKKLCRKPVPAKKLPMKRLLRIPPGDWHCRVRAVNPTDTNSCVTSYYQQGPGTIRDSCLNELLSAKMKEPLFNKLRTKQQLGYGVFCQPLCSNGILGFSITVETHANKFGMSEVAQRVNRFMMRFQKTLNKMNKVQFQDLVRSCVVAKQVEDTQLGDETSRYWQEILDRYYVFDRQEREISTLRSITFHDLKTWYYNKYLESSHRHISFQVEGSKHLEMDMEAQCTAEHQGIALTSAAARGDNQNYLKLIAEDSDGPQFIKDLVKFREGLQLYPVSKIVT
ncbi:nardilysin-like isoform X2 [Littorina saxatilis]|uniref:nardilysin-like isoform X2 n=1 Tax=Littorina saxatilis TaxID=31220 RepID=UPI0038B5FB4F